MRFRLSPYLKRQLIMKLTVKCIIILVLSVIISCTTNKNEDISFKRIFEINNDDLKAGPMFFSDIFTEVNYIKLETQKDNLIRDLRKLNIKDDRLYIFSWNGLYVFDNQGKYLFKLDKSGRGPGEFINANDILIDDNTIDILDIGQRKIVKYDKTGNFIDEFRYGEIYASRFFKIEDDIYIFYVSNRKHPDLFDNKHFNILIYKNDIIQNAFYPITAFRENLRFMPLRNFFKSGSLTLFQDVFNDTIYKVTSAAFTPYYYINFKDKKINPSNFNDYKDTGDLINKFGQSGLAQLLNFFESENFIVFSFIVNNKRYNAIFDKISTNMKVIQGFTNDIEMDQLSHPVLLNEDKLYFYYESYDFLERYHKNNLGLIDSTFLNIIKSSAISDNPIIVEAQIKRF